jgi:hypothetical protein
MTFDTSNNKLPRAVGPIPSKLPCTTIKIILLPKIVFFAFPCGQDIRWRDLLEQSKLKLHCKQLQEPITLYMLLKIPFSESIDFPLSSRQSSAFSLKLSINRQAMQILPDLTL